MFTRANADSDADPLVSYHIVIPSFLRVLGSLPIPIPIPSYTKNHTIFQAYPIHRGVSFFFFSFSFFQFNGYGSFPHRSCAKYLTLLPPRR